MQNQTPYFIHEYFANFNISSQNMDKITHYKLLKWDASFFLQQWNKNIGTYAAGTIRRYNEMFHVQFCNCSISKLRANPNAKLMLSFRKAEGMPAFVMVMIADREQLTELPKSIELNFEGN